jgi:nucleotide-binding universal stress UspA family protein
MSRLIAEAGSLAASALPIFKRGDPRVLISDTAQSSDADLIVIGKHGRSRLAEYFMGGTTRLTLARAQRDIAVVPEARPNTG